MTKVLAFADGVPMPATVLVLEPPDSFLAINFISRLWGAALKLKGAADADADDEADDDDAAAEEEDPGADPVTTGVRLSSSEGVIVHRPGL